MRLDQNLFSEIVSGRRPDAKARVARALLRMASLGYRLVVEIRNVLYNYRILRTHRVNVPVLCIGNLTTGGTGKTPLVAWLCQTINHKSQITNQTCHVAILTRGYKTRSGEASDEPALLAAQCPDVPVVVNPDRVAGAIEAIHLFAGSLPSNRGQSLPPTRSGDARDTQGRDALATGVLVMDDGFQHRRLARDLDIIAIDATVPFGYGRLLPAGLLREPVSGLKRAHAVVLTRCDQVSEDALAQTEAQIRRVNPDLAIARSIHAPTAIRTTGGAEIPLAQMKGKQVFAFCGIGNPQAFFRTIKRLGAILAGTRAFDDHHRYTAEELVALHEEACRRQASLVLTTQKDWTKVVQASAGLPEGDPPLACLTIDLKITAGEEMLTSLIDRVLGGRIPVQ